jgi:carbonic anhydrase/acetyltransferase-like protein (isoleucine patch superfamily)
MFTRKDTYTIPEGYRERFESKYPCVGYKNNIEVDPECYLSPDCRITGKVKLGYHAVVMAGAQIRSDSDVIEIGAESNIQENCVLHESSGFPLIIGEHSTIGHGAVIHGCIIGDNALVGMGATVLDGARIGNNALVGAGAVIPQGMEVPDHYMAVGVPAKLRGPMDPDRVLRNITSFAEANLVEARNMLEAGLMEHPNDDLLRKIGAID